MISKQILREYRERRKMISHPLNVAVPWSLSHYISFNGFHPLYRALFDHAPENVTLSAWDNVKLHRRLRSDDKICEALLCNAKDEERHSDRLANKSVARAYEEYLWPPDKVLTTELMGDIEFHHTVPFPSLTRPFVFHCESFGSLLSSFVQDGIDPIEQCNEIRAHFWNMLASPLCLGIFSHVDETLEALHRFFSDPAIDRKLFRSRIGLSENVVQGLAPKKRVVLSKPRFLFMNSRRRSPDDFFHEGGHLVLRFWKEYLARGQAGLLIMSCRKPGDEDLSDYGVDISLVRAQTGRSIIWGHDCFTDQEETALVADAQVLLLPSASLQSVLVMKAMMLGAIPVVTDTVGASMHITDDQNGIVLQGVRESLAYQGAAVGICMERYVRQPDLEDSLISQLTSRACALLNRPDTYRNMRTHMIAHAQDQFSGRAFGDHFWSAVSDLYHREQGASSRSGVASAQGKGSLRDCTIQGDGWARVFESSARPRLRVNTGLGVVWELSGAMIHAYGNPRIDLNDWSVLAQYYRPGAPQITFANTLDELAGKYLYSVEHYEVVKFTKVTLIGLIAKALKPFPRLYRLAAHILSTLRGVIKPRLEKPKADPDVELVRHGVCGHNIIRRFDRYYAILQSEGAFIPAKAESGGYSFCFSGYSLEDVEQAIAVAHDHELNQTDSCSQFSEDPHPTARSR